MTFNMDQARETSGLMELPQNWRKRRPETIMAARAALSCALDEIERLQAIITEPVESFGTPELITWARELQVIIAEYPESERGSLVFVMRMGSHLEKFSKGWNCMAMKQQAARIAELEGWLIEERASYLWLDNDIGNFDVGWENAPERAKINCRKFAELELQQEDKIGSSDHIPDAMIGEKRRG